VTFSVQTGGFQAVQVLTLDRGLTYTPRELFPPKPQSRVSAPRQTTAAALAERYRLAQAARRDRIADDVVKLSKLLRKP
jgi:hypothetical protein